MAQQTPEIPILKVAWTRYAQMDAASTARSRGHLRLRRWIAILGILATLFALLSQVYPENWPLLGLDALKAILIATAIMGSVLASFVNKFYASGDWLALRAGAEGILREIYTYRTILQNTPTRRAWLEERLADIQRQMYRNLGGELVLKPYKGNLPPYYYPNDPDSDAGYASLTGEQYFTYRLQSQLAWHIKKVNQYERDRKRLQWSILLAGGAGAFLAAWGQPLTMGVALTAAIVSALTGWNELRNLDAAVKNYSKVILELTLLYDHWKNLEPEERTETEFFKMVQTTEELLWSQNIEYIKAMQEALSSMKDEKENLVTQTIKESIKADADFKAGITQTLVSNVREELQKTQQVIEEEFEQAVGSISADLASERAQQELQQVLAASGLMVSALQNKFKSIAEEFAGIEFGKETPKEILHARMSKYPSTGELKG
jgi:hypothetical protein